MSPGGAGPPHPLDAFGTARASRLFPGPWLAHADLHNHTWLSDGRGDPERAFASMRESGLDVAALTDHAVLASRVPDRVDLSVARAIGGIDEEAWERLGALADAAHRDGAFVAWRGFEWSNPVLGHVNVWGSARYTEPLRTLGADLGPLYRWLVSDGADGLASFNHPGRTGPLRFREFRHEPALSERLVGLEVFNKAVDYLFVGASSTRSSPLVRCLDAGWRPGLVGVSDEHGTDWGAPKGKGRTGLYVGELTRAGVREALLARRCFATRHKGLRLDASLGGARMGTALAHRRGPLRVELDVDRGESWWGRPLSVQVLRPGHPLPAVAAVAAVTVPRPDEPVASFAVDLDAADGLWVVLRVSDPAVPADPRAPGRWASFGEAVAYASPFWLEPGPGAGGEHGLGAHLPGGPRRAHS